MDLKFNSWIKKVTGVTDDEIAEMSEERKMKLWLEYYDKENKNRKKILSTVLVR